MGCSLQKKIQELRENLGVTHCNPQYVLAQVSKELGVVAKEIREHLKDAKAVLKNSPKAPYFLGLEDAYTKVLGLLVESGTLETLKIMEDKKLMKLIRDSRKKGSKSSPYEPLVDGDE